MSSQQLSSHHVGSAQASAPALDGAAREALQALVSQAVEIIPLNWPLRSFAYRNPLMGFEHLPFTEAVAQARDAIGGEGYLPLGEYRAAYAAGRISEQSLTSALRAELPALAAQEEIRLGAQSLHPEALLLVHLRYGLDRLDPKLLQWQLSEEDASHRFRRDVPESTRSLLRARAAGGAQEAICVHALWSAALTKGLALASRQSTDGAGHAPASVGGEEPPRGGAEPASTGRRTVAGLIDDLAGTELNRILNEQMIKWCAAFVDEGMADWSMPSRGQGFYRAWRDLAPRDATGRTLGISDWAGRIAALPEQPEDALASCLQRLGVPEAQWQEYLRWHLGQLPGWAGYIRWRGKNPDYPEQGRHPIDPLEYLSVRVFHEYALAETVGRRTLGFNPVLPELLKSAASDGAGARDAHAHGYDAYTETVCGSVWRLFHMAQFLALRAESLEQLSLADASALLTWLDRHPADALRPIWQVAYESEYRSGLIRSLAGARQRAAKDPAEGRPRAQAAFCIDARSEPFRRHLEAQGEYGTLGFAGFFATPIYYRTLDSQQDLLQCPVLIKPRYAVEETPRAPDAPATRRHELGDHWRQLGRHLFHQIKANPTSSYLTFDLLGSLFGLALVGKTVLIKAYEPLRGGLARWLVPPVPTRIPVDRAPAAAPQAHQGTHDHLAQHPGTHRFAPEEQAAVVENALRVMSLTRNFARLVLLCGHGSTTENNPYASAYHCGACGGNPGGPNARVLAALANKPEVRHVLGRSGIEIPADTWFIAGEHNTTTDHVSLFDLEELPVTHTADVRQLRLDLEAARLLNAAERCGRLPGAPRHLSPPSAARHAWLVSRDWAQIRPEWGLSSNAAFVIGRRSLTRDLNLGGRVFLHHYDQSQDATGKVLEAVMTAPLVVVQMINFQYYFSATDSWAYGSGTKVLHNVVSGVGVMLGRHGDLQTGFPFQAVTTGSGRYHEPLRLLAVLEAETGRIAEIISRHVVLQNFFENQWICLVSCDPLTGVFAQHEPGGHWRTLTVPPT